VHATDTASAPRPASAPASAREATFNAAKAAAEQRQARSLAAADEVAAQSAGAAAGTMRRVGDRLFTLKDGEWVDSRYRAGLPVIRVKAFSAAYFEVLKLAPELRAALALGDRVTVAGRAMALAVGPSGAERLSERELAAVRGGW
jgi:hypothetical protein